MSYKSKFPPITDPKFATKIDKIWNTYHVPKRKPSYESFCNPRHFELQTQQKFLKEFLGQKTPYKNLLIFHKLGAGKTCTAISITEEWAGKKNIIIVSPASLTSNFRDELRSPCTGNAYLTDEERLILRNGTKEQRINIIRKSDQKINKIYNIMSINMFIRAIHKNQIKLKNTLLVIDEVQNVVSETGDYYKSLYGAIINAPKDLMLVLLSATPIFDKPNEIALTMNLLRLPEDLPVGQEFEKQFLEVVKYKNGSTGVKAKNLDKFKEATVGYISYYKGAPDHVFPKTIIRHVNCEMSDYQYQCYKTVLQKHIESNKKNRRATIVDLPLNFLIGPRVISNISFPQQLIGKKGYDIFSGTYLSPRNLRIYSCKLAKLMEKVT